jgi:hypothetical protein
VSTQSGDRDGYPQEGRQEDRPDAAPIAKGGPPAADEHAARPREAPCEVGARGGEEGHDAGADRARSSGAVERLQACLEETLTQGPASGPAVPSGQVNARSSFDVTSSANRGSWSNLLSDLRTWYATVFPSM